ncbi:putative glycosyltransferase At5g25310 [Tasmannia lanceolata]|uniref:putative glycosyltransferase At5g25310 n=1 Tax=Tasmannia lanceolata TaxID=3420 RepID=UPI004064AC9C
MGSVFLGKRLCQIETKRLVLVTGMIACAILLFQSFTLPYRNVLSSLIPAKDPVVKMVRVGKLPHLSGSENPIDSFVVLRMKNKTESFDIGKETGVDNETKENEEHPEDDIALEKDGDLDDEFDLDGERELANEFPFERVAEWNSEVSLENDLDSDNGSTQEKDRDLGKHLPRDMVKEPVNSIALDTLRKSGNISTEKVRSSNNDFALPQVSLSSTLSGTNGTMLGNLDANSSDPAISVATNTYSTDKQANKMLSNVESLGLLQNVLANSTDNSTALSNQSKKKKKWRPPPVLISEMNHLLLRSRISPYSMKPRWSSQRDQEILSAKLQIENAPIITNHRALYAPVFRNISMFKRSYELMERILKVYVYKDGEKPIFHQPVLKGIYASEGWFMKLMEGNKHFVARDPRKAHLFYIPLSTRMLQFALYVPGSHNRHTLVDYLKNHIDKIAAKYRFWNRTGGEDHFLVACHDWAPAETRHNLNRSIRALCNCDIHEGFRIGKDVSLPETYVRAAKNPLRDLGGSSPSKRPTLAFYAGNMHGRFRPILLRHWENKDPDMKILGPMPVGVKSKMTYIQYMKTSKYCLCPRGYEVNSPRVVEAIFYECVPVLISDNFVPPFFEVLNWEAFSVFIAEKDVRNLKDILLSIPEKKYLSMQLAVKKVQQHFLWHSKPVKYDVFHMTLHSVWFNRLFQMKIK